MLMGKMVDQGTHRLTSCLTSSATCAFKRNGTLSYRTPSETSSTLPRPALKGLCGVRSYDVKPGMRERDEEGGTWIATDHSSPTRVT